MPSPSVLDLTCLQDLCYLELGGLLNSSVLGLTCLSNPCCRWTWMTAKSKYFGSNIFAQTHVILDVTDCQIQLSWVCLNTLGLTYFPDPCYLELDWLLSLNVGLSTLSNPKSLWVWLTPNPACSGLATLSSSCVARLDTLPSF
jgi:hypothetical protein